MDSVGSRTVITDPTKVRRLDIADRCGRVTQRIIDPDPKHLQMNAKGIRAFLACQLQKIKQKLTSIKEVKTNPPLEQPFSIVQKFCNQKGSHTAIVQQQNFKKTETKKPKINQPIYNS